MYNKCLKCTNCRDFKICYLVIKSPIVFEKEVMCLKCIKFIFKDNAHLRFWNICS